MPGRPLSDEEYMASGGRDTVLVRVQYGFGKYKGAHFKEGDTFKVSRYFLDLHPKQFVPLRDKPGPKPGSKNDPKAEPKDE